MSRTGCMSPPPFFLGVLHSVYCLVILLAGAQLAQSFSCHQSFESYEYFKCNRSNEQIVYSCQLLQLDYELDRSTCIQYKPGLLVLGFISNILLLDNSPSSIY